MLILFGKQNHFVYFFPLLFLSFSRIFFLLDYLHWLRIILETYFLMEQRDGTEIHVDLLDWSAQNSAEIWIPVLNFIDEWSNYCYYGNFIFNFNFFRKNLKRKKKRNSNWSWNIKWSSLHINSPPNSNDNNENACRFYFKL